MRVTAALVAPLLLATACRIPEHEDAAAYRAVLDAGLTAVPQPPGEGAKLDVATAMRLANARDEALAAQGEAYVRSILERRRALAAFLPTISLSPRLFFRDRIGRGDTQSSGLDVPLDATVRTSPVADLAELRRTDIAPEGRRALLLAAQDELLLDVGAAHFAVLLAERLADVLRSSIRLQDARVDDVRARIQAGLQRPLDLALAESRAADARADLVQAETVARNGRTLLAFLTGWPVGDTPLDERLEAPASPARPLEALVLDALVRRPEVAAAQNAVAQSRIDVQRAYGGYWPSVSVDLTQILIRDSEPVGVDWTAAFELSIPLFKAGLVETDVREALSRWREARLLQSRTRREVARDVETTFDSLAAADRRIVALRVQLDASRRALDLAQAQGEAGLSTQLERLTAQDDLLAVELDLASSELFRRTRQLELLRAVGRIHEIAGLARDTDAKPEAASAAAR